MFVLHMLICQHELAKMCILLKYKCLLIDYECLSLNNNNNV